MFRLSHRHTSNPGKLIGETRVPRILCGLRSNVKPKCTEHRKVSKRDQPFGYPQPERRILHYGRVL
jgi:hypothetical protein